MYNGVRNYYAILLNPVAAALVVMSEAIDHPNATLDWSTVDALETQMATLDDMMGSIHKVEFYDALATLRPTVEAQRHLCHHYHHACLGVERRGQPSIEEGKPSA